ncbi:MAG: hypothetical protein JNL82_29675 [Myxococcales bacterium]|nr:hypothetical protein [Myxococcales bacterium]
MTNLMEAKRLAADDVAKLDSSLVQASPTSRALASPSSLQVGSGGSSLQRSIVARPPMGIGLLLPGPQPVSQLYAASFITTQLYDFIYPGYSFTDQGKIFRPSVIFGPQTVKGVVIMAHGELGFNGSYDDGYTYTMDHIGGLLAAKGFVCLSVRPRPLNNQTSVAQGTWETIIRHLIYLNQTLGTNLYVKGKPLALVGHSQAGPAASKAGTIIRENHVENYSKVHAVVSLAGTAGDFQYLQPAETFLALAPVRDGDIPSNDPLTLMAYERANPTGGKYLMWMWQCNHIQMLRSKDSQQGALDGFYPGNIGMIGGPAQNTAVANYVAMFLLWKLADKSEFATVFLDGAKISYNVGNQETQSDLDTLTVLPRFDRYRPTHLYASAADIGFVGMWYNDGVPVFDELRIIEPTCVSQTTRGFVVSWDRDKFSSPRIDVNITNPQALKDDVAAIEFFAVVVGSTMDEAYLSPASAQVFLWDGFVKSKFVAVNIEPSYSGLNEHTITCPSTIRIPLSLFGLAKGFSQMKVLRISFLSSNLKKSKIAIGGFRVAFT